MHKNLTIGQKGVLLYRTGKAPSLTKLQTLQGKIVGLVARQETRAEKEQHHQRNPKKRTPALPTLPKVLEKKYIFHRKVGWFWAKITQTEKFLRHSAIFALLFAKAHIMKIVIAGAGDVGFHLAELLSTQEQNITLIDLDEEVLHYASTHLDVLTLYGDASLFSILEQAEIANTDLVLAVTTSEKTNLITAILAKKMGARQTVARVNNPEYLASGQKQVFKEMGVDSLISPEKLAAEEIKRLLSQCSFTDVFPFEEGKLMLVGLTLQTTSPIIDKPLAELNRPDGGQMQVRPIAVLRGKETIIPRGDTMLRANDHVYFISRPQYLQKLEAFLGQHHKEVRKVMILGGSDLATTTARLLENLYDITFVEPDKTRCKKLADSLSNTLIIHGAADNIELLKEEGLEQMDAFIALTPNSETNIVSCLMAKSNEVPKTIAQVENREYIYLSQNIGVDTLINKKLIAANNIFRFVRRGQVEAITGLHGVDAEIIEFVIQRESKLTKHPLREIKFPEGSLIAGIIRQEESIIPDGNFQLKLNDKVIVMGRPNSIPKLEQMFE